MSNPTLNDTKILEEAVRGIFSEEMSNIVINAPSNSLLIYSFLVIAVVLIVALVLIIKIATNSANKAITTGVAPYIEQLKSFHTTLESTQQNYITLSNRLNALTEELISMRSLRSNEEDMFKLILKQFDSLSYKVNDNITNINTLLQDHERQSFKRTTELQKFIFEIRLHLLTTSNNKVLGNMLVDRGLISRDDLNTVFSEFLDRTL